MQEGNRLFRRFDQLAVAVDNIQHLAPAGRLDLPFEAAKCRRARVIPADVDHYMASGRSKIEKISALICGASMVVPALCGQITRTPCFSSTSL